MSKTTQLTPQTQSTVRTALFIYYFIMGLCFSSWASRIPEIKHGMGLDDAGWGTMLLMIPLGQIVGMSFSGRLIAKVGSNIVVFFAMIGYSLSLFAMGSLSSQIPFIASLVMFGFFGNFCNIGVNTQGVIIENYYAKPIMASFHAGWSLAGLLGGLLGLLMTVMQVSTSIHFAIVTAITIFFAILKFRHLQYDAAPKLEEANSVISKGDEPKKERYEKFLIYLGIVGFFGWAAEGTMTDWNGIYLHQIVGFDVEYTPIGLTLYMVTMTVGRFVMDRAIAKWGRRLILSFCGGAIFVGMFMAVLLPNPVVTLLGFMVVGLGACGVIPAIYSVAGEKSKIHTGRALTIVSTISFAGFLIGPPLIGYIAQATNLRYSFALIGIFGLIAWLISSRLKVLKEQ